MFFEVAGGNHHLLCALHQQTREADGVRRMLAVRFDQFFRWHLDSQIDDFVTVVSKDNLDQVLADVVHVALDGCENDLPARRAFSFLHEAFQVADRGFHGFGGLQHFGDDQFVVIEQATHFRHAGHQRRR